MADYNIPQAGTVPGKPGEGVETDDESGLFALGELKKQYYDYLSAKSAEIEEWKESGRYYHGAQWTAKEIKALKRRRQPVTTSNRIVRKLDAVLACGEIKAGPESLPAYA